MTEQAKAPTPAPAPLKLWYPKDKAGCHIALTSGHTFLIPGEREGIVVPKQYRREAIARGCLPVGMEDDDLLPEQGFDRKIVIRTELEKMVAGDDPDAFTRDGMPSIRFVEKRVGFRIERTELLTIWAELERDEAKNGDE